MKPFAESIKLPIIDYDLFPGAGFKFLEVSGEMVRYWRTTDDFAWKLLAKHLPRDVHVIRTPSDRLILQGICETVYRDTYLILLGSRRWPEIKEGAVIPLLEPIIIKPLRRWDKWYWRLYRRIGTWFVAKFPRWVKL